MGVYLIIAILILVYGVGKEWLEPAPPRGKELDLDEFRKYQRTYSLKYTKPLSGKEYIRTMNQFYITPEELKNKTKERNIERFESIYKMNGLKYPKDK